MGNKTFRQVSTTVTTDWTDILEVICEEYASMEVEIINGGAVALSDFQVLFRNHADGNYYVHQGASSVAYEIAAPGTLAGSGKSYLSLDVSGVQSVKLQAKTGATSTTISVYGNMSETDAQIAVATESKQDTLITAGQAIQAAVEQLAVTNGGGTRLAAWVAAVDNTADGQTLATLKASALEAGVDYLRVRPQYSTDDLRWNPVGNASGTSAIVAWDGVVITASQASTAKFFCTAGCNVSVDEVDA